MMVNQQSATNQRSACRMRQAFALLAFVGLVGCQGLGPDSGAAPGEAVGVTTLALPDDALPSPWTPFDTEARAIYAGVELGNRKVLVCGGTSTSQYVTTCNQLSLDSDGQLRTQSFPLPKGRVAGTLSLLPSNRVLLAGGSDSTNVRMTARVSLPVASWADGQNIWGVEEGPVRIAHTATVLDSSVVLIGGQAEGEQVSSIAVRREDGDWTNLDVSGDLAARGAHTATVLKRQPGGPAQVLILGGYNQLQRKYLSSGFIFSLPNTIKRIADMPDARKLHTATLLDDGSVLVVGGEGPGTPAESPAGTILGAAWRYYPDRDSWVSAGSTIPRRLHAAARFGSHVIVAGGETVSAVSNAGVILAGSQDAPSQDNTVERYDPAGGTWSAGPNLLHGREKFQLFTLDETHLLAVGGISYEYYALATSELLTAGALGQAWKEPNSCLSGHVADGVCCNTDCGVCHWCNDPTDPGTCRQLPSGVTPIQNGCPGHLQCSLEATCATTCGASSPCEAGYFCDASSGKCSAVVAIGIKCGASAECAGGAPCVDGVCCDSACEGSCESCNQPAHPGSCLPLPAGTLPTENHPKCPAATDPTCAASCDGNTRDRCVFPGTKTHCADASCTRERFQPAGQCDGSGACDAEPARECAYGCDDSGCVDECLNSSDCAAGKCIDRHCVRCNEKACNDLGYQCDEQGAECRNTCQRSETDCAGSYYCHPLQHRCVKGIALPAEQLPSCAIGREPLRSRHSMLALGSLLCVALAWRKRRVSRRRKVHPSELAVA